MCYHNPVETHIFFCSNQTQNSILKKNLHFLTESKHINHIFRTTVFISSCLFQPDHIFVIEYSNLSIGITVVIPDPITLNIFHEYLLISFYGPFQIFVYTGYEMMPTIFFQFIIFYGSFTNKLFVLLFIHQKKCNQFRVRPNILLHAN